MALLSDQRPDRVRTSRLERLLAPLRGWWRRQYRTYAALREQLSCGKGHHRFVNLAQGYAPYRRDWLTIDLCERCHRWRHTSDDTPDQHRNKKRFPMKRDCMRYDELVPRSAAPWAHRKNWAPEDRGPVEDGPA